MMAKGERETSVEAVDANLATKTSAMCQFFTQRWAFLQHVCRQHKSSPRKFSANSLKINLT